MKRKKNNVLLPLVILLIILNFIFFISYFIFVPVKNDKEIYITVEENTKETLKLLKENNLIKSEKIAYAYLKFSKSDQKIVKGNFIIPQNLNLIDTINYISNIENIVEDETVLLTFVEGDWNKHIARKFENNTNLNYEELMMYWNDKEVYNNFMKDYPFLTHDPINKNVKILLEGYLSPNTYEFYRNTNKEEVTRKLLDQTNYIYQKYLDDINKSPLSFHDILTLASIVQYESGSFEDMKTIAGVFYNRLERGMRLESSVTRCYVINQEREDSWENCEYNLNYNDPYDTYQNYGLPPGPIVNPGEDAIAAVLNPNKTDYLYFVGDLEGKTYFAKDLQEHEHNYCKYVSKECK